MSNITKPDLLTQVRDWTILKNDQRITWFQDFRQLSVSKSKSWTHTHKPSIVKLFNIGLNKLCKTDLCPDYGWTTFKIVKFNNDLLNQHCLSKFGCLWQKFMLKIFNRYKNRHKKILLIKMTTSNWLKIYHVFNTINVILMKFWKLCLLRFVWLKVTHLLNDRFLVYSFPVFLVCSFFLVRFDFISLGRVGCYAFYV